jgi:hypothetical protein
VSPLASAALRDRSGWPLRGSRADRDGAACAHVFHLMKLKGRNIRNQSLYLRSAELAKLLARSRTNLIRSCESFPDEGQSVGVEGREPVSREALRKNQSGTKKKAAPGLDPG